MLSERSGERDEKNKIEKKVRTTKTSRKEERKKDEKKVFHHDRKTEWKKKNDRREKETILIPSLVCFCHPIFSVEGKLTRE